MKQTVTILLLLLLAATTKAQTVAAGDSATVEEVKKEARQTVFDAQNRVFLYHHDDAEVDTPEDKVPACAVPHSGEEPHDEDVHCLMLAVAAHRDIYIIAEEAAERDMPAMPEVGDGVATIRMTEVLIEMETYHAAETYRHVAISGEIEIYLEGKGYDAYPRSCCGKLGESADKKLVGDFRQLVCHYHLLAQSYQEAEHALGNVIHLYTAMLYLMCHRTVSYYRSCHKLREHGNVEQQVGIAALHGRLSAVDVNEIRDALERVEADAYRQGYLWHLQGQSEACKDAGKETEIFEDAEYQKVYSYTRGKGCLTVLLTAADKETGTIVDKRAEYHQEHIYRLSPGIEDEREDHQHHVLEHVACL